MESKELYRHLLGINEPWTVERVDLWGGSDQAGRMAGRAGIGVMDLQVYIYVFTFTVYWTKVHTTYIHR